MKLTKAKIAEQVDNIKKVMKYPSRLNDDLKYGEIGRLVNSSNKVEEVSTALNENGYVYNEDVINLFYDAVVRIDTLSTAKITDYVYQEMKNKNAKEENDKDLYTQIADKFKEYDNSHNNISEYAYDFFTNLNEYVPGIIEEHYNYERKAEDNYSRSFHNPISFIDNKEVDYLLQSALQNDKLNKVFSSVNHLCIKFQKEIENSDEGQFSMTCFEVGVDLSNMYSRLTSYGPNSI